MAASVQFDKANQACEHMHGVLKSATAAQVIFDFNEFGPGSLAINLVIAICSWHCVPYQDVAGLFL